MRKLLPLLVVCLSTAFSATSQTCPSGYIPAGLNWDALDYFPTNGYAGYPLSGTMSPNQSFAFGKNRLTVTYTGVTSAGENGSHTAETGSYGTGEDVEFAGNGTITLTFASEVTNLKFSLYDLDMAQKLQLSATNATAVQQIITVTCLGAPSKLTLTGNNTTSPLVEDNNTTGNGGNVKPGTDVAVTSPDASINVDIAGPVKTITLTTTNLANIGSGQTIKYDSYFLSDISACTNSGTFPLNYYAVSKPFDGMPAYVLVAINNAMYQVDPATGRAKKVFEDGASSGTINSLAYDPYNKVAYFCWSLTNNGSTTASARVLRKYDFTTGNVTSIANDVSAEMSIPTFNQGTESGAAAFYDGALYLGIEGGVDNGNGGGKTEQVNRESIIWRLDFPAGGGNPTVTQAYGVDGDKHDWSDFTIIDGMLYDFNGDATYPDYHHFNMQTGVNTRFPRVKDPKQCAVGWDGTVYWISSTIAPYTMNGNIGAEKTITSTPAIPNWTGSSAPSFGDAAEAFRPAVDFGDAPIAYDPNPDAPALHEKVDNLRLGGTTDVEWTKPVPGLNADADGADEDAIPYAPAMMNNGTYQIDVSVFNNTGGNATLIGWLDIDGDNIFEPTEAITAVVPSQSSSQSVSLYWPSTVTSLPSNSYTYLRLRLTSAANNMTTSTPSGYFADGEVEDWRVMVNVTPLAVKLTDFGVRKTEQGQVDIRWNVTGEEPHTRYELQKSADGQHWTGIYQVRASTNRATAAYQYMDAAPYQGDTYYRLKITEANEGVQYSAVGKVVFDRTLDVHFAPNPAAGSVRLTVQSEGASPASIRLLDMNSRTVYEKAFTVAAGMNQLAVPLQGLAPGVYQAEVLVGHRRYTQKLVVRK